MCGTRSPDLIGIDEPTCERVDVHWPGRDVGYRAYPGNNLDAAVGLQNLLRYSARRNPAYGFPLDARMPYFT